MARRNSDHPLDGDDRIAIRAQAISQEFGADFEQTFEVLRRLREGLPSIKDHPAHWPNSTGLDYAAEFLLAAYRALPWNEAVNFFNTTSPADLEQRVLITRYLAGADEFDGLPLFSRQELAQQLRAFREFLLGDRQYLLETGLPSKEFSGSRWLTACGAKLYVTKRTDFDGPFDAPVCFCGEFSFYNWIRIEQLSNEFNVRRVPCRESDADLVVGISSADADRLRALREKIFDIKTSVLAVAAEYLESSESDDLWKKCLPIIRSVLTAEEIEFCLRMDRRYREIPVGWKDVHPMLWRGAGYDGPINPGGLASVLGLIWHVQRESSIGTMHQTCNALSGLVVDEEGRRVLSADDEEWAYFEYADDPTRESLDRAIAILRESGDREEAGFEEFQKRISWDFGGELECSPRRAPLQNYLKSATAGRLPNLELTETNAGSKAKRAERVLVRFPSPDGLQWEEVKMEFVSTDSIKVSARKESKVFTFAEMGFKDDRKGDRPDTRWNTLRALAKNGGEISWQSEVDAQIKGGARAAVKEIRARLRILMGINDDPFYPYKKSLPNKAKNTYKTKFSLSDKSFSDSGSADQPEIK